MNLSGAPFEPARNNGALQFSYEVFPGRTSDARQSLVNLAAYLDRLQPRFVSVTYGAAGSGRSASLETVQTLRKLLSNPVAGHLTCAGASRQDTDSVIDHYVDLGIRHFVALRGDGGAPGSDYAPHPEGYINGADLAATLSARGGLDISVAAYPEVHPNSPSPDACLENLKIKLDAGANRAITQFFFDNADYFRFLERVRARGIAQPIVPGILMIHDFTKVVAFAGKCAARIPAWVRDAFDNVPVQTPVHMNIAADIAARQVLQLAAHGIDRFHIYTMNRADLLQAFNRRIGVVDMSRQFAAI